MIDKIDIINGDITKVKADAIVNAANNSLLGGGGVDGAIHRAAGKALLAECKSLNGCKTGDAKITGAYNIKNVKFIIHTVGPVYKGTPEDRISLKSCYTKSLQLTAERKLKTIAFPAISCGVYGYPIEKASETAIKTILNFLSKNQFPEKVIFVLFSNEFETIYNKTLSSLLTQTL